MIPALGDLSGSFGGDNSEATGGTINSNSSIASPKFDTKGNPNVLMNSNNLVPLAVIAVLAIFVYKTIK